jgi:hypothetical protein
MRGLASLLSSLLLLRPTLRLDGVRKSGQARDEGLLLFHLIAQMRLLLATLRGVRPLPKLMRTAGKFLLQHLVPLCYLGGQLIY